MLRLALLAIFFVVFGAGDFPSADASVMGSIVKGLTKEAIKDAAKKTASKSATAATATAGSAAGSIGVLYTQNGIKYSNGNRLISLEDKIWRDFTNANRCVVFTEKIQEFCYPCEYSRFQGACVSLNVPRIAVECQNGTTCVPLAKLVARQPVSPSPVPPRATPSTATATDTITPTSTGKPDTITSIGPAKSKLRIPSRRGTPISASRIEPHGDLAHSVVLQR